MNHVYACIWRTAAQFQGALQDIICDDAQIQTELTLRLGFMRADELELTRITLRRSTFRFPMRHNGLSHEALASMR